jgi:hypothetical protein
MPTTFSRSVVHHGKRHRFSVTAKEESEETAKEALEELSRQVADFESKIRDPSKRAAYRKRN